MEIKTETRKEFAEYIAEFYGFRLDGMELQEFIDLLQKIKDENVDKYKSLHIDIFSTYEQDRSTYELISVKGIKEETEEEYQQRIEKYKLLCEELDKLKESRKQRTKEVIDRMIYKRLKHEYGW